MAERAPEASPAAPRSVAAMGNQAFTSLAKQATVARQHKPDPDEPAKEPPVSENVQRVIAGAIIPPLDRAADELLKLKDAEKDKKKVRSIRARVEATIGAYGAVRLKAGSHAEQRFAESKAHAQIACGLMAALIAPKPDQNLRMAWGKSLGTLQQIANRAPKSKPSADPGGGEVDKRALIKNGVIPAVTAAIGDIPAIVKAESSEEMMELRASHLPTIGMIAESVEDDALGRAAATQFQQGLEIIRMFALPDEQKFQMIAAYLDRAAFLLEHLEDDEQPEPSLADEPEPPDDDPSKQPVAPPPDPSIPPAPSPNPLPPPPPPPPSGP